jgi:hypothetical protein
MVLSFYLSADNEQIRLRVEEPPDRPRYTIQDPKMMVTIAWNPLGFHLLDEFPKGNTFNVEYYRVNIITELLPLRPQVDERRLLFMLTTQNPIPRENAELSANKIGFGSPYTHPTYLISHHPASLSSDISNIVCRESLFHHLKNYLQQFMKSSEPSRDQPCKTCFGTR